MGLGQIWSSCLGVLSVSGLAKVGLSLVAGIWSKLEPQYGISEAIVTWCVLRAMPVHEE